MQKYYFASQTQTQDTLDNDSSEEEETEEENNNAEGKHKKKYPPQPPPSTPVTAQKRTSGNNNAVISAGTPTVGSPLPPKIFASPPGSIQNPYANVRPSTTTLHAHVNYLSALKTLKKPSQNC